MSHFKIFRAMVFKWVNNYAETNWRATDSIRDSYLADINNPSDINRLFNSGEEETINEFRTYVRLSSHP